MENLLVEFIILLNRLLLLLGLRKQHLYWGIVYDSASKQPLDPAIVKLVDAKNGRVVRSAVTDMAGRYSFLAHPGKFKILVKKSNYVFPSVKVQGDFDQLYDNLYHGEFFELKGDSEVVPFNIPMDPVASDWNQAAKAEIGGYQPYEESLFYQIVSVVYWLGLVATVSMWLVNRFVAVYWLAGFYIFTFALAMAVPRPRWWGRVWHNSNGQPAIGYLVTLSYVQMPDLVVARAFVQEDGKYILRTDPGKYLFEVRKVIPGRVDEPVAKQVINVGSERVVNRNFKI